MNCLLLFGFIIALTINNAFALEGSKTSITYLSSTNKFKYSSLTNLVVFGDSLSSIDTNFFDMSYTGNNLSQGDNWTVQLKDLRNMTLWNFSVAGAVIDPDIVPRSLEFKTTFRDEYRYFLEKMTKGRKFADKWNSDNSLFAFWLGTTDILNLNHTAYPQESINNVLETIVNVYFTSIKGLYDIGARNFLFINVQSIDDMPGNSAAAGQGVQTNYDVEVNYFNESLKKHCQEFNTQHPDTNFIVYNMFDEIKHIMDHFQEYNFSSNNDFWSDKGLPQESAEQYLWADGTHTTFKTNNLFVGDINALLASIEINGGNTVTENVVQN